MATASSKSSATAQNRVPVLILDDFRDILRDQRTNEQPEGWYTTQQISAASGLTNRRVRELMREGVQHGAVEFADLAWVDWDGVNRRRRVFRSKT